MIESKHTSLELELIEATKSAIQEGRIKAELLMLPTGGRRAIHWQPDMVIHAEEGSNAPAEILAVEIKVSDSRRLPSAALSQVVQQLHGFREANSSLPIKLALVTNAELDTKLLGGAVPSDIVVFSGIKSGDIWKDRLSTWFRTPA